MNPSDLFERYTALDEPQKTILATMALVGSTPGKSRLVSYLGQVRNGKAKGAALTLKTIESILFGLLRAGLIEQVQGGDCQCKPAVQALVLKSAMADGSFERICADVDRYYHVNFANAAILPANCRSAVMLLRMAMLRGQDVHVVTHCLAACQRYYDPRQIHPYLQVFVQPFDAELFALLQPLVQEAVLVVLLPDCLNQLEPTQAVSPNRPKLGEKAKWVRTPARRRIQPSNPASWSLRWNLSGDSPVASATADTTGCEANCFQRSPTRSWVVKKTVAWGSARMSRSGR